MPTGLAFLGFLCFEIYTGIIYQSDREIGEKPPRKTIKWLIYIQGFSSLVLITLNAEYPKYNIKVEKAIGCHLIAFFILAYTIDIHELIYKDKPVNFD